jgi:hypothetical protein
VTPPRTTRNAAIASAIASGAPASDVAELYGITPQRARQIAAAGGVDARRPGRRRTDAITPASHRGRALLARLVADASAADLEPEVYLDRLRTP